MSGESFDLAVVGGGINGCGIARDAAGRGLATLLIERGDLACGTSSASSKLAHGGLRYLEHGALRLVRESLREREILLRIAPHLVRPLRFVLPQVAGMRPAWLMRMGLFLYDHLDFGAGAKSLPPSRGLDLRTDPAGEPLRGLGADLRGGFAYSDCWADDARLTIANAVDAARSGAAIRTRVECEKATPAADGWNLTLRAADGEKQFARARCLVNAAGPWAGVFLRAALARAPAAPLRLVQGSHIVLPRLYAGAHAYILQNFDRRAVFAIPFADDFTLIGATDRDISGDPAAARASDDEVEYLLTSARRFFGAVSGDIAHRFCGVRALVADDKIKAQDASRDYALDFARIDGAPLLNVFGGKLTTFRKLAENALAKLRQNAPELDIAPRAWTAAAPLPGGDLPRGGIAAVTRDLLTANPAMRPSHATRLARAYGSECKRFLIAPATAAAAASEKSLLPGWGECFGGDLFAREVDYLIESEWAQTAEDILWRRGYFGLVFSPAQTARLESHLRARRLESAARAA